MIPRWIRYTDGLLALVARPQCRRCLSLQVGAPRFSSSSTVATSNSKEASPNKKQSLRKRRKATPRAEDPPIWPLLRRNSLAGRYRFSNRPIRPRPSASHHPLHNNNNNNVLLQHSSTANRLMLIVDGLSSNLLPSDFYRIGPSSLPSWGAVIKKVQQRRDPITLEAQGQYWISFDSAAAAVAYRAKLVRLHELSLLKLRSPSGLWESSVPAQLQTSLLVPGASGFSVDSAAQLNRLVDGYTVAPASLSPIHFQRRRVSIYHPWDQRLAGLVQTMGFGARPFVVLVDVYPPMLTAENLFDFIRVDGRARGMRWQVAMPRRMQPANNTDGKGEKEAKRAAFRRKDWAREEMLRGRFVLACVNETEAQRFHRAWNGRTLSSSRGEARYVARTSVIRW